MKKYFVLLWTVLLCCVCIYAQAGTTANGLEYTVHDTYVEITGYTGNPMHIIMPETIEDLPVTHIADEAFSGATSLYMITLPEGLLSIGDDAFSGCASLR